MLNTHLTFCITLRHLNQAPFISSFSLQKSTITFWNVTTSQGSLVSFADSPSFKGFFFSLGTTASLQLFPQVCFVFCSHPPLTALSPTLSHHHCAFHLSGAVCACACGCGAFQRISTLQPQSALQAEVEVAPANWRGTGPGNSLVTIQYDE